MGNDDTRDRGSVVGSDEYELGGSPDPTIIGGDTQKTDTQGAMYVVTSVKETDAGFFEQAVRKKEFGVIDGTCHRPVVGVGVDGGCVGIVGLGQATNDDRVARWGWLDDDSLCGDREAIVDTQNVNRLDGKIRETGFKVARGVIV